MGREEETLVARARRFGVPLLAAAVIGTAFAAPPPAHAATIRNVPASYASISLAIAASSSGDTVRVAPGTYFDNFTVPSGVTVDSSAGAATTIIKGVNGQGPIAIINAGGVVKGLTLRDGGGNVFGGAAQVAGLLQDSLILDNKACYDPAIVLNGGTVQNNYFEGNSSVCFSPPVIEGSGQVIGNEFADNGHSPPIRLSAGLTLVEGNFFHDPQVILQTDGGDLTTIVRNNLFLASGGDTGGLIQLFDWSGPSGATIVNNTFVRLSGSGRMVVTRGFDSTTMFANNIFVGISGANSLECENDYDALLPTFQGNDFWTPTGTGLGGACTGLVGSNNNVSTDPKFVSSVLGDYHLRAASPLIDAGVNGIAVAPDIDGEARPIDGDENGSAVVDPGFDESTLALALSPESVDFGSVPIGKKATRNVTATNVGAAPITIDTISIETFGDFGIDSENCPSGTLAVGASCTITVSFTPSGYGHGTATLTVGGPGHTGSLDVLLGGDGSNPLTITPDHVDISNAIVGVGIKGSISLANAGGPITITNLAVHGTNPGDLVIGAQTCTAAPIPQNGSCSIPYTFTAAAEGPRNAIIEFDGSGVVGHIQIPVNAYAYLPSSNVTWAAATTAGSNYSWNEGGAMGRTVQSGAQRLHLVYSTNRVSGAWATDTSPRVGVYYIRNTTGTTWGTPKRLNPSTQHAAILGLAAAGSRVYAIWVSQTKWINYSPTAARVLYVRVNTSHGSSTSWRSTVTLTSTTGRVDYPVITATGTDAHIAYTDAVTGSVRVASSRDYGVTWTKTTLGTTSITFADGRTGFPTVAASGSTVAYCWLADVAGTVNCRVSTDRGVTWGSTTTIGSQANGYISAAVRGTRVAVTWTTAGGDVVLRMRNSGTWQTAIKVPTGPYALVRYGAQVALQDTNRVAVAYAEENGSVTQLRWIESTNNGGLWFAPAVVSGATATYMRVDWPSVLWPSAGTRYVAMNKWTENTSNYRIYFKKGTGTPTYPTTAAVAWSPTSYQVTVGDPHAFQPALASQVRLPTGAVAP